MLVMSDTEDLQEFQHFLDFTQRAKQQVSRQYLRDFDDPFTKYSVKDFFDRYRFTPQVVKNNLIPMVESDLRKPTARGLPFAPEIMILISLRYYATGSFQKLRGDVMGICQQSVSRIIATVSVLLAKKMKDLVKFPPKLEGISSVKQRFYEIADFPGVVGCLGCTHIKIKNPGGNAAEVFRNREGWFSINVQAVVGPDLQFLNLVARWPGSTQDNFIFNSSSLKQRIDNSELQGILLGDSSYTISPVVMTPFLSPSNAAEERYNKSLMKTRNVLEQAFEIWKRRFPCLQFGMGIKLETVVAVICACATLHNIAILSDDIMDPLLHEDEEETMLNPQMNADGCGFTARDAIVQRYFQ